MTDRLRRQQIRAMLREYSADVADCALMAIGLIAIIVSALALGVALGLA